MTTQQKTVTVVLQLRVPRSLPVDSVRQLTKTALELGFGKINLEPKPVLYRDRVEVFAP